MSGERREREGRRPKLLLLSALPPPTGGIPTWTLGLLASDFAHRFEIRVVSSSPSRFDAVSGESHFRLDRARDSAALWMAWPAGAHTTIHPRGGDFPEFVAGTRGPLRHFVASFVPPPSPPPRVRRRARGVQPSSGRRGRRPPGR